MPRPLFFQAFIQKLGDGKNARGLTLAEKLLYYKLVILIKEVILKFRERTLCSCRKHREKNRYSNGNKKFKRRADFKDY